MTRLATAPQRISIAAPPAAVLQVIRTAAYHSAPASGRNVHLVGKQEHSVMVAYVERGDGRHALTIKRVTPQPPDLVICEYVNGPFSGAMERVHLEADAGLTRVTVEADFEPNDNLSPRAQIFMLESAIQEDLEELRLGAESRGRPWQTPVSPQADAGAADAITEGEMARMVEDQELTEWGHVGHGRGVARIAIFLAQALELDSAAQDAIGRAALLHDIGKVTLESDLWGRLSTLSPDQRALMRAHAIAGAELAGRAGLPSEIQEAIRYHHERWDGAGNPDGLAATDIPLAARILWMGENVDSMIRVSYRRESLLLPAIERTLREGSGAEWDPQLVDHMVRIMHAR
jgi:putative nucleotidyltransferase with HDIG domain